MAVKTRRFTAVTEAGFHHSDGFVSLGQTIELTDAEAERGIASGRLVVTPESPKAQPKAAPNIEENV